MQTRRTTTTTTTAGTETETDTLTAAATYAMRLTSRESDLAACLTFELGLDYFGCSIHLSSLVPRPNLASAQNTKTEKRQKKGSQHNEMVAWSAADWTRIVYSTIRIGVGGGVGKREVNVFNKGNKVCTTCE